MSSLKDHPVDLVEDDQDDQEIFKEVFRHLHLLNNLKIFDHCPGMLEYIRTTTDQPLLILSDINLPGMSGIELRQEIIKDEYLKRKSIPFVFLTTSKSESDIERAYELQVQGYFVKEDTIPAIERMLRQIIDYWTVCRHPNNSA